MDKEKVKRKKAVRREASGVRGAEKEKGNSKREKGKSEEMQDGLG